MENLMKKTLSILTLLLVAILTPCMHYPCFASSTATLTDYQGNPFSDYRTSTSYIYDSSFDEDISERTGKDLEIAYIVDLCLLDSENQKIYALDSNEYSNTTISVTLPLSTNLANKNIYVYTFDGDEFALLNYEINENIITYHTTQLEKVYIATNAPGLNVWMIVVICLSIILLLIFLGHYFKLRRDIATANTYVKNKEIEIEE